MTGRLGTDSRNPARSSTSRCPSARNVAASISSGARRAGSARATGATGPSLGFMCFTFRAACRSGFERTNSCTAATRERRVYQRAWVRGLKGKRGRVLENSSEERSQSRTAKTVTSAKIGKLNRVKRRAGSLPEKHASHQPVQQGASQQAQAAPVEKAGVVVGHTKAMGANRMPRRTHSK